MNSQNLMIVSFLVGVKCGNQVAFPALYTENFLVSNRLNDPWDRMCEEVICKGKKFKGIRYLSPTSTIWFFAHALIHKV